MQMERTEEGIPTFFELLPEEITSEVIRQDEIAEGLVMISQIEKEGLLPNCRIQGFPSIFYGHILFIRLAKGSVDDMTPDDLLVVNSKIEALPFSQQNLQPSQ